MKDMIHEELVEAVLEESDRDLILLSLALCSILRPGFLYATENIATLLKGEETFHKFRSFNEDMVETMKVKLEASVNVNAELGIPDGEKVRD